MAITDRKRDFAAAKRRGATNKQAAIDAGYSEKTASAAGSRLIKDPVVIAEIERKEYIQQAKQEAKEKGRPLSLPDLSAKYDDPMEFLKAVMNDPAEDLKFRTDAAKTLMPYLHQRKESVGKKDSKNEAAGKAAGKFPSAVPPKLVANGGKPV